MMEEISVEEPMHPDEEIGIDFQRLTQDEVEQLYQDIHDLLEAISQKSTDGATDILDYTQPQITTDTTNPDILGSTQDQSTAILQEFEEFQRENLPTFGREAFFIDDIQGSNDAVSVQDQVTLVLQDFEVFETTVLPSVNAHPADAQNSVDGIRSEDTEMMIEEMTDASGTLEFMDASHDCTSHFEGTQDICKSAVEMGSSLINSTTYGGGIGGTWRVHYIKCSNTPLPGGGVIPRPKKKKRKYRGVIETDEQTARRLEMTRIKNKATAARAHETKKAYFAYLQTQLPKLRRRNRYLKNFIRFLEGHIKVDIRPQPLRRTLSGIL